MGMRLMTWQVYWHSPYTQPPDGMPRELLRITDWRESSGDTPAAIEQCWREHPGYCVRWTLTHDPMARPAVKLSEPLKQRRRRQELRRRLTKRYPLFAEVWFREAVEERPDYYGPNYVEKE
jgi:hypothetical protein